MATLYDVKFYNSKATFIKDKNNHFAGTNYKKPRNGFLIKEAKRLVTPVPISGKLGFFEVELKGMPKLNNKG